MSYSDKLLAIDDEMVALGRPPPPVVSWLSGKFNASTNRETRGDQLKRWNDATRVWRERVEAWEDAHDSTTERRDGPCKCGQPMACGARWLELRQQYIAQDLLERKARYDTDAWNYEMLRHLGCPDKYIDTIRGKMVERQSYRSAREWMLDPSSKSLVLIGAAGCGKSVAAAWLAHQKLMRNFGVQWVECRTQADAPMWGLEAELRRHQCRTANVLFLDDLGAPGQFARKEGPWLSWLDDIMGGRANNGLHTVITTNRSMSELAGWLGASLADRLKAGSISTSNEKSMRGQAI